MRAMYQPDRMAGNRSAMAAEKKAHKTAENETGSTKEKETIQAAQEKAKEEEEKSSGLWEIRARFKNLADNVLPKQPYLMGISSNIHITRNEGPDWRRGTPFSPNEERMQYVSFQRVDHDETILRSQPWEEETAKISQPGSTRRPSSESSGQTPYKKMSVEEYFRKKNPGSADAHASREGSTFPPKAEANVAKEENKGSKAKSKISLQTTESQSERKTVQGDSQALEAQATSVVAPTEKIALGNKAAPEKAIVGQKEAVSLKEISTHKAITPQKKTTSHEIGSTRREDLIQKPSAGSQGTGATTRVPREKEVAIEKDVQTTEEGMSKHRKRPIEAVAPGTDSEASSGHQVAPSFKKARVSSGPGMLARVSPPKQTNSHGFPPLLSPTLPASLEEELANLQKSGHSNGDRKADREELSDERTGSSRKKSPKSNETVQKFSSTAFSPSNSAPATLKQPGSNSSRSKITEAAQTSMFFGQPRRGLQSKKPEVILQPKQSTKKADLTPKAEENQSKVSDYADSKGKARGHGKTSDLTTKAEDPSKIHEHAQAKRRKDVGSGLQGPVLNAPGSNAALVPREKKSIVVILKIPRSKRRACLALLRFSPRPRKPNGLQSAATTASKEHGKVEMQANLMERQVEIKQTAGKGPMAPAASPRPEANLSQSKNRGQKRPASGEETVEGSKKRPKPSDDGDEPAVKSVQLDKKDGAAISKPSRLGKSPLDGAEKRSRPAEKDDPEPLKKRVKLSDGVNPAQSANPANSAHSGHKSSSLTAPKSHISPTKAEVKSVTMRRIASMEGEPRTPTAAPRAGTPTVPGSAERANREGRPASTVTSATLTEEGVRWRAEQQKYLDLGRELKHELDGIVKRDGVLVNDPVANKKGCPIGVESILCYILGFTALDELSRTRGRPASSSAWETLLPHIDYVKAITSSASHIYGLILQLEAVVRDKIHTYDIDRLDREPSTITSRDFTSRLAENARSAYRAWRCGTAGLSWQALKRSFPKTWAQRINSDSAVQTNGHDTVGLIPGYSFATSGYHLPLTSTTTAVEAVKMGWTFLAEWAEIEGVEWKGRMF